MAGSGDSNPAVEYRRWFRVQGNFWRWSISSCLGFPHKTVLEPYPVGGRVNIKDSFGRTDYFYPSIMYLTSAITRAKYINWRMPGPRISNRVAVPPSLHPKGRFGEILTPEKYWLQGLGNYCLLSMCICLGALHFKPALCYIPSQLPGPSVDAAALQFSAGLLCMAASWDYNREAIFSSLL